MDGAAQARAEVAAGILHADPATLDDAGLVRELRRALNASTVWRPAHLPPELRGGAAHGDELARWVAPGYVGPEAAARLAEAWAAAVPLHDGYLRLRVDGPADVRHLRSLGGLDGLTIVPSLDPRSTGPVRWRWPFRLGVVSGPFVEPWLAVAQRSEHHGHAFDADRLLPGQAYDIALVDAFGLGVLPPGTLDQLRATTCVIAAGFRPADQVLDELQGIVGPTIAIAVDAPPERWWRTFFHELAHDEPVDVAVERVVRDHGVDALTAGPLRGMDVTAAAHWFAAVAPDFPQLTPLLEQYAGWDWRYESGGTRRASREVLLLRAEGEDPTVIVLPGPTAAVEEPEEEAVSRRLVARVFADDGVLTSVLPPAREVQLAVRVAIPEREDVAADGPALAVPPAPGPTAELEVTVSGDVWDRPPPAQTISLSRVRAAQPSTWAVFPFTTPAAGQVVELDITVSYRGKPLQAARFVATVRERALPDERPTLTTYVLSGPDEPTPNLRPVDVTLDGRGTELRRHGVDAVVPLDQVHAMLDTIDDRVSRVLGVTGAPDVFVDPAGRRDAGVRELVIALAAMGAALVDHLAPLRIGDAGSINLLVNDVSPVLPLELAYAGPVPDRDARFCVHVTDGPPARGTACTKASRKRVCPYAFWGLHRSIARTIAWREGRAKDTQPWITSLPAARVLFAATELADEGAADPLPSDSVPATARQLFWPVTRVTSWTAWRRVVRSDRPNVLVVLGHTLTENGDTHLYIGRQSTLSRFRISASELRAAGAPRPLVLLVACATATVGDAFGTLPGTLTARGAGAVVATLSKIVGPQGAAAANHLLQAMHGLAGSDATVGDVVAAARRSLLAAGSPIGLVLVAHGELDTTVVT
ncbi:hypothetical protein ACQEVB_35220 [Pseudonocardia sp. CA-107938]|uniref:hypothetical protein n=1 Tax=Pseudonocardia sp. CA-107938 TaxID=3240021 RepID=UPI003D92CA23